MKLQRVIGCAALGTLLSLPACREKTSIATETETEVVEATPAEPEPAVEEEMADATPAIVESTPEPTPEFPPEPTPEPVLVATPTPAPAVVLNTTPRNQLPTAVRLVKPVQFPAMFNGRQVGSVTVPAGVTVRLMAVRQAQIEIAHQNATVLVEPGTTDVIQRIEAAQKAAGPVATAASPKVENDPVQPVAEFGGGRATGTTAAMVPEGFAQLNRISIDVLRKKQTRVTGGDYDDKTDRIVLSLKFSNADIRLPFPAMSATVYIFGKSITDRDMYRVLAIETFQVPQLLPRGEAFTFETKQCATGWDNTNAKWGERYSDWLLVLKDSSGRVITTKSTSEWFQRSAAKVSELKVDGYYSRNFEAQQVGARYRQSSF